MEKKNPNEYLADLDDVDQTLVRLLVRALGYGPNEPGFDDLAPKVLLGLVIRAMGDLVRAEIARDVAAGGDGNVHKAIIRLAAEREAAEEQKGRAR